MSGSTSPPAGPLAGLAPSLLHPVANETMESLWRRFDRDAHPLTRVALPGEGR